MNDLNKVFVTLRVAAYLAAILAVIFVCCSFNPLGFTDPIHLETSIEEEIKHLMEQQNKEYDQTPCQAVIEEYLRRQEHEIQEQERRNNFDKQHFPDYDHEKESLYDYIKRTKVEPQKPVQPKTPEPKKAGKK